MPIDCLACIVLLVLVVQWCGPSSGTSLAYIKQEFCLRQVLQVAMILR